MGLGPEVTRGKGRGGGGVCVCVCVCVTVVVLLSFLWCVAYGGCLHNRGCGLSGKEYIFMTAAPFWHISLPYPPSFPPSSQDLPRAEESGKGYHELTGGGILAAPEAPGECLSINAAALWSPSLSPLWLVHWLSSPAHPTPLGVQPSPPHWLSSPAHPTCCTGCPANPPHWLSSPAHFTGCPALPIPLAVVQWPGPQYFSTPISHAQ